jgi:hypothetical protein
MEWPWSQIEGRREGGIQNEPLFSTVVSRLRVILVVSNHIRRRRTDIYIYIYADAKLAGDRPPSSDSSEQRMRMPEEVVKGFSLGFTQEIPHCLCHLFS